MAVGSSGWLWEGGNGVPWVAGGVMGGYGGGQWPCDYNIGLSIERTEGRTHLLLSLRNLRGNKRSHTGGKCVTCYLLCHDCIGGCCHYIRRHYIYISSDIKSHVSVVSSDLIVSL